MIKSHHEVVQVDTKKAHSCSWHKLLDGALGEPAMQNSATKTISIVCSTNCKQRAVSGRNSEVINKTV